MSDTVTDCNLELEQTPVTTAEVAKAAAGKVDTRSLPAPQGDQNRPEPLFATAEADSFRKRWEQIQTEFVDDPRGSVKKADEHVAATIKRLAEVFAGERTRLEREWDKGDNVSTEDLRQALRRYRSFFDRLLTV